MKYTIFLVLLAGCSREPRSALKDTTAVLGSSSPFAHVYVPGETITYRMTGSNQASDGTHVYSLSSQANLLQDNSGAFYEDTGWRDFTYDGQPVTLDSASQTFRQQESLDPRFNTPGRYPNEQGIDTRLFAPADDLFNFYVDLWAASQSPRLRLAGDHVFHDNLPGTIFMNGQAETFLDIDFTVRSIGDIPGVAVLAVQHLPPKTTRANFPAAWMQSQVVAGTPNNIWAATPNPDGSNKVIVGSETIIVEFNVEIGSGKIQTATLRDSLLLSERICGAAPYNDCQDEVPVKQVRSINISQQL